MKRRAYRSQPHPFHNHRAPVTRREFLAQGVIASSATFLLPSALTSKAWGAECQQVGGGSWIPFLVFDMAGGAALPGNFLVGTEEGPEHLLPSYDQLGWNPRAANSYDRRFGLPMGVANVSTLFNGIITTASAEAQARLRMGSFCHRAQDDTSTNPLSAVDLVMRAGYRGGSLLKQATGTVNSTSGGNSRFGTEDLNLKPLFVDQVDTLSDSMSLKALRDLPAQTVPALGDSIQALGKGQWQAFSASEQAEKIEWLGECLLGKLALGAGGGDVDPRRNPVLQRIYGINQNTSVLDGNAVAAAVVSNVIQGTTGPGVITVGGCDYHDGDAVRGNRKDLEMGQQIGRAVQYAHEMRKPFFFQLITDGGCYADPGTRNWRSDAGDKCMSVIGYYNPTGAPSQLRQQVGWYTSGQGVALTSIVGSSPLRGAHAAFVNYLNVQGRLDQYETLTRLGRDQQFNSADMSNIMIFDQGVS